MAANFTGLERACGRRIIRFHRDHDRAIISLSPASVTEHTLQDGADYDDVFVDISCLGIVETPAFRQRLSTMENPSVGTIKFASRRRHNSVLVAWGNLEEIVSIKTDALVWKPYEAREGRAQKKPKKAREGKSQESANDRNGDVEEAGGAEEDCEEEEEADEGKDTV